MRLLKKGCRRKLLLGAVTLLLIYIVWIFLSGDHYVSTKHEASHYWCGYGPAMSDFVPKQRPMYETEDYPPNVSYAYRNQWVGFPDMEQVDCNQAFNSSVKNNWFPQTVPRIFPHQFKAASANCNEFIRDFGFLRYPKVSEEEENFPLAFIVLFYKDLDQVLFLLRAIYRPHNVYCLSVDTKSSVEFLDAVRSVSKCLPNVFVASKLESIVYAGFSRLMADINCMEDLLQHPIKWKYVVNLPGQQFPLRSNLELVKIFQVYNGANDVEGITGKRMMAMRFMWRHDYVTNNVTGDVRLVSSGIKNRPPPHGINIVKGSAYGTFSRDFIDFVINHQIAKDFLEWCKTVLSPDEYFWATLHHSKVVNVPGGYTGVPDTKPWLSTYASWGGGGDPCATIRIRSVCIFSPEDLPLLINRKEMFANKFYITHHPAVLHCLDQLLYNVTFSGSTRDLKQYQDLPFALKTSLKL
ncbi:beta-1,3-galactosyl-O-glycosyl-glycoprotein beta-1,6-N-acetylglucosaminyltransferase 4 [Biomphalaria glabrata]|nr:beta-1,3-galactosyl-O-glycosyl-glycoprotein beta-1,6-N-acetylglucosaminyltransferase 4 [Biomphalaria glabrata]